MPKNDNAYNIQIILLNIAFQLELARYQLKREPGACLLIQQIRPNAIQHLDNINQLIDAKIDRRILRYVVIIDRGLEGVEAQQPHCLGDG
jgi:hypothetical protein